MLKSELHKLTTPLECVFADNTRDVCIANTPAREHHRRSMKLTWTQFERVAYKPRRTGARIAPVHIWTLRVHAARPRDALVGVATTRREGITRVARRTLAVVTAREVGTAGTWAARAVLTFVNVDTLSGRRERERNMVKIELNLLDKTYRKITVKTRMVKIVKTLLRPGSYKRNWIF